METLLERERELKKRWPYPYRWGRVQDNTFDGLTRFVYDIADFAAVLAEIKKRYEHAPNYDALFNYALNRWYNFWSAQAVEEMFCALDGVTPARDPRDRLVDFAIQGIRFDHKTSVYPRGFGRELGHAVNHPDALIRWLYEQQSQQGRKHYANRLFVVLYAADGQHWKLKAELTWLRGIVQEYVATFAAERLWRFTFEPGTTTLSDVIWAVKCK